MKISELDEKLKEVCSIDGISFGKLDDPSTWEIQYNPNNLPTEEQIKAVELILYNETSVELDIKNRGFFNV